MDFQIPEEEQRLETSMSDKGVYCAPLSLHLMDAIQKYSEITEETEKDKSKEQTAEDLAEQCAVLLRDQEGNPYENLTKEYFLDPKTSIGYIQKCLMACMEAVSPSEDNEIYPKDSESAELENG